VTRNRYEKISFQDTSIPVVILHGAYQSLGIARSLGRLGITVYSINKNASTPSLNSRYCRGKFVWDIDNASREENIQRLLYVAKEIGKRSILVPINDEGTIMVADYASVLSESYIFPNLSPQLIRALVSKKEMYFTAKKHGIPTPEACFPESKDDVEEYASYATFPVMLKEIYSLVAERRMQSRTKLMFVAKTKEELCDLYDRYEDLSNPNFMLQEYIPGAEDSVWMFNGYFNKRSDCLFGITGRKIRQYPAYTGATSLGVCLKNDIIAETTRRFMKNVGYQGMLDIGYRYDKRDGKYKVLDINTRIGATFRLFVGNNGLDVVRAEYLDLTGQRVPSSKIIEGRKWFVEDNDLSSSIRYYIDKNMGFREWVRSYRGVQEAAWFASDDLYPFFLMCKETVRDFLKRLRAEEGYLDYWRARA
jgi:D-aspartate ligase